MGFYARRVLPRLLEWAMRNHALTPYRQATITQSRGVVIEIGVGSGLNLPLYTNAVERVYAIDPSPELLRLARRRVSEASVPVSLLIATAEQLPFPESTFDTVVMTWTLCSIGDPLAALTEMRRVLRPHGQLLFVEHGRSDEPSIARWQALLTPGWRRIGGGCHLDRDMAGLMQAAGFEIGRLETGYMPGPKPWTFLYRGRAGV
jgi:ubiquinone/menaquinone biosynthesis C-methylase UbiE